VRWCSRVQRGEARCMKQEARKQARQGHGEERWRSRASAAPFFSPASAFTAHCSPRCRSSTMSCVRCRDCRRHAPFARQPSETFSPTIVHRHVCFAAHVIHAATPALPPESGAARFVSAVSFHHTPGEPASSAQPPPRAMVPSTPITRPRHRSPANHRSPAASACPPSHCGA